MAPKPPARKKPMRVLCLGPSRTGTTSLSSALRKLGYTPHTIRNVISDAGEMAHWTDAIQNTLLSTSKLPPADRLRPPYGLKQFDEMLGDYDAVADFPAALFARELIELYPEAKVILTVRKYEDWEKDVEETWVVLFTWRLFIVCSFLGVTKTAPFIRFMHLCFRAFNRNIYSGPDSKKAFEKHYQMVRELVPKGNLLEFGPEFEWEPLCKFLGEKVPKGEKYPHLNQGPVIRKRIEGMYDGLVWLYRGGFFY
ncbi:hypothetical protein P154DRAFT_447468 [Amniculicola lignicola CBS 123094]|uniref:NAD dependent epimerase/dehydratase n=1 Tax=Amniculicola lignicola CBS 123094 TaxID=1392246 RepID=A0A6A5WA58_9PLEO|nr:hypothetical protein P154DRAFT_447468 [Amniculicola lignicola CBS 123094]